MVLHLSELTKLSNTLIEELKKYLVLHLSELTKLSNGFVYDYFGGTVLHLSELTKLSNLYKPLSVSYKFYIFLN